MRETETETQRKMVEGRKTDCRGGVPAGNCVRLVFKQYTVFACKRRLANNSVALVYVFISVYACEL